MRTLLIASLLVFPVSALAQTAAPEQKPRTAQQQHEQKELLERQRLDGAAGGTAPVPEEKRKPVNANAGPHKRHVAPTPSKLPRDEPVEPPK